MSLERNVYVEFEILLNVTCIFGGIRRSRFGIGHEWSRSDQFG